MMHELMLFAGAYLLGSIPTALWVSRWFFGIDIREHGSKNMGATNTFRVLGPKFGVFVLCVDMGKGMLAVKLANLVQPGDWMSHEPMLWQLLLGLMAIVGHLFPVFAAFRGGKGVATLFGMVLAIQPWTALLSVAAFLLVVWLTRYVSLGSLIGVLVFMALVFFALNDENIYLRWFSAIAALLVFYMHRTNILRLIRGTESKIRFRSKSNDKKS